MEIPTPDILAWGYCLPRGVQGLWLAAFFRVVREVDLARLSPRVKRAQSDWRVTATLGCPRCQHPEQNTRAGCHSSIKLKHNSACRGYKMIAQPSLSTLANDPRATQLLVSPQGNSLRLNSSVYIHMYFRSGCASLSRLCNQYHNTWPIMRETANSSEYWAVREVEWEDQAPVTS
jgi:hypothetical protein